MFALPYLADTYLVESANSSTGNMRINICFLLKTQEHKWCWLLSSCSDWRQLTLKARLLGGLTLPSANAFSWFFFSFAIHSGMLVLYCFFSLLTLTSFSTYNSHNSPQSFPPLHKGVSWVIRRKWCKYNIRYFLNHTFEHLRQGLGSSSPPLKYSLCVLSQKQPTETLIGLSNWSHSSVV